MIISTDNTDNNYSLTIMLPGNGSSSSQKYETNVNVIPENHEDCQDDNDEDNVNNVSRMTINTCKIIPVNTQIESSNSQPEDFDLVSHPSLVIQGMNQLRNSGQLLDVKLVAEGKTFKAHRVVLSSCSDYFRAMFTEPMRERHQDEIQLTGINAEGLELIIDYIYTSKLSLNLANIQTVLSTATHLQIVPVIGACSAYLKRQLDMINCVDVITLAENYALPRLRKFAYNHISQNFMNLTDKQLHRLTLEQLDHLLGGDYPVNASELSILKMILQWLQKDSLKCDKKAAATLLSRMDFAQITAQELQDLKGQNDQVHLMLTDKQKFCDTLTEFRDEHGLLNLRGMQLSIVKIGGFGPHGITNKIAYWSTMNSWLPLTTIPHIECSNFGCAVLQNSLYVIGGCFNATDSLATLSEHVHPFGFAYDPRKNEWSRIAPMNRERCRFTLVPMLDKLVAIGGCGNELEDDDEFMGLDNFDASVELYDSVSDTWRFLPAIPRGGRSQHAATSMGKSKVLISGGISSDLEILNDCLVLDLLTNEWSHSLNLLQPRADHVMIQLNPEEILVIGGWAYDMDHQRMLIDTIDKFNHVLGTWEVLTRIPTPRFHCGVALVGHKIHLVGGFHSEMTFDRATGLIEIYDMKSRSWNNQGGNNIQKCYPEETWEHACVALHIPSIREEDLEETSTE